MALFNFKIERKRIRMTVATVEKNDVDISPIFAWNKEFSIEGENGNISVYMRIVGDADINKARVSALRRSAELRRKLRDENSDERFAFVRNIDEVDEDTMISVVIVFSMRDLTEQSKEEVKLKIPKQPRSDAKTELHEQYQAEVDAYPAKYQEELRKIIEVKIEKLKKDLKKLSREALYKKYEQALIDELCERELMTAFREWTTFLSVYRDPELRVKFFDTFEEFANLPSDVKSDFIKEYSLLELTIDDLKKLRPVTP